MDIKALLQEYDRDVRMQPFLQDAQFRFEWDGPVFRFSSDFPPSYWNGVSYSDLTEETADAAIARQLSYFKDIGHAFEWKLFDYDRPADLARRLEAAGLTAEAQEAFVGFDLESPFAGRDVPDGIEIRVLTELSELEPIVGLCDAVYGADSIGRELVEELRRETQAHPGFLSFYGALAGDLMVCAGWMRLQRPTRFASLWGGATLPDWRGKGIYSALVAARAAEAKAKGFRWLTVDCSPDSRPILERRGFRVLSIITPYIWSPDKPA